MSGLVFDVRKYSIHDGPGIRTAVFLKGCPLRCRWCHNPEGLSSKSEILRRSERCVVRDPRDAGGLRDASVILDASVEDASSARCTFCADACPLGLDPRKAAGSSACAACEAFGACAEACPAEALQLVGRKTSVDELMAVLREDVPFYEDSGGGVTFTGGEPLAQPEFLLELLRACRLESIHSAVDTSGWASKDLVLKIGELADLVLFDLKAMDEERHLEATGVSNRIILDNLRALAASGARIALRIPLIPGVNDDSGELGALANFAVSLGSGISAHILPYHELGRGKYELRGTEFPMGDTRPPSVEAVSAAAGVFERAGVAITIGG